MSRTKIGVVTAFFPKISVAEVELTWPLFAGEYVLIGEHRIKVDYLYIEHAKAIEAKPGDVVGIKTDFEVKIGDEVCK